MDLTLPNIQTLESDHTYGKFVVEPLERGYGVTLGNSLRRVLLSSIPGAAITYVEIDKVLHEFSTIPGVKEDTTELLLNLKDVFVMVHSDGSEEKHEPKKIHIDRKGEGVVTGADIECPSDVEVVNPEAYIATISDEDARLSMTMTIETNKGYVLPERQERRSQMGIGVIPMGAAFTPVRKVNYTVEATRMGSNTNLERLVLGGVHERHDNTGSGHQRSGQNPAAVFRHVRGLPRRRVGSHRVGTRTASPSRWRRAASADRRTGFFRSHVQLPEESQRILTINELVQFTETDLMQIRNFGKKSLTEVREKLGQLNLSLKGGATVSLDDDDADADTDADTE